MDITIRRLATEFYLLKKSLIPQFSYTRRIARIIGTIDPITKQITDGYQYIPFSRKYFFRPLYYKMFNSWSQPLLQNKEFKRYLGNRNDGALDHEKEETLSLLWEEQKAAGKECGDQQQQQNEGAEGPGEAEDLDLQAADHQAETFRFPW